MSKKHHFYKALRFVFFILIITIVAGCAGKKSEKKDTFFEKWKIKAEQSKGFSPSAGKRAVDLPKMAMEEKAKQEYVAPEPEKSLPSGRISMKMREIELSVFLRTLAKAVNQNIIINEKVSGKVNINIEDAPWDQVFESILRSYGLAYAWEGDLIRILTLEDMQQDIVRQAQKRALERVEPLVTKVVHVKYANPKTLRNNLWKFLQSGGGWTGAPGTTEKTAPATSTSFSFRGAILVDPHTNSLMIQAIQSDIDRLLPLIEELDRPTRQIRIEANIVETSRDTARELGIQWGGLYKRNMGGGKSEWVSSGANSTGITGKTLSSGVDPTSGMALNFPSALADGAGMTLGYVTENLGKHVLNVQLSALQQEGKLNILSSPSITTLDNQMAFIESGKEVPFKVTSGENIGDIEYKRVVIKLEVTPYVIDEKTLKLKILTNKDDLDWVNAVSGNPAISTKKAETNVVLFDGQTTVIAGLSKENIDDSESGVPWLKDIPILGYLFKGTSKSNSMEDVLIFITPHILKEQMVE